MSAPLRWIKEAFEFSSICAACGLDLSWSEHSGDVTILREIFVDRIYSDWFPFHADATVVDVGAHVGFFSLFASRRLGPKGRILALEPVEATHRRLARNLERNRAGNVDAMRHGLWSRTGTITLHLGRSENATAHPEHHELLRRSASGSTEDVQVSTLEQFMADHDLDRIDFLKLDCEGAEYGILLPASDEVLGRVTTISLEFHDLRRPGCTGLDLARRLARAGFRIATFAHGPTTIDNDYGQIIAVRG